MIRSYQQDTKLSLYSKLVRLDKPIGIFLLLWPTLWALFIAADGIPPVTILVVFVTGVILMRSAGCAINDYADRDIDPFVARTRMRPVASGAVAPKEALLVAAVLSLIALVMALIFLNMLTIYFAIGAVILAATYPFMKRLHFLPQVHLGVAFACSIPMAFTAIHNTPPPPMAWLIFTCAVIWTTMYDTLYAMADREDDLKIGVKSTAILFGNMDKTAIALLQTLVLLVLAIIGRHANMTYPFYIAMLIGAFMFLFQQRLIKHRLSDRCVYAFLNNNYFGLVIFLGILGHYVMRDYF